MLGMLQHAGCSALRFALLVHIESLADNASYWPDSLIGASSNWFGHQTLTLVIQVRVLTLL